MKKEEIDTYITSDGELEKEDFYIKKKEPEPYNFKIDLSRRRKYKEIKDLE